MPIYVYKCTKCVQYHEALQKSSDPLLITCPSCLAEALIKVIAPVGVIFKGTGFHKNDYTSTSAKSTSSGTAATPTGSDKSDKADKADKPAAAADSAAASSPTPSPAAGEKSTSSSSGDSGGSSSSGDKVA